jgi:hypothetical protein
MRLELLGKLLSFRFASPCAGFEPCTLVRASELSPHRALPIPPLSGLAALPALGNPGLHSTFCTNSDSGTEHRGSSYSAGSACRPRLG